MIREKKAIVFIYVLFLVTISVIFATILLNNNSFLFNITELFEVDSKLTSNIDKDSETSIKLSKEFNSNWSGFIDNISCPWTASISMSWTVNKSYISSSLVYSWSLYCEWTYLWDSVKIYFNTWYTDFDEAEYLWNTVTLSGGLWLSNFSDSDNTLIDFTQQALDSTVKYAWTASWFSDSSYSWSNPTNAQWNTTSTYAQTSLTANPSLSNTLWLTNFSFTGAWLPSDAIINGIKVQVERQWSASTVTDYSVQLTKDWVNAVWNNLWLNTSQTSKSLRTYWSSTNKWWTTWTKSEVEASTFWVLLRYNKTGSTNRTANVYRVNITINYSTWYSYFVTDWYDDNFNSDNYRVTSSWTTSTGTYYPNSWQDDDNFARKIFYGFVSPSDGYKKIFWNTTKLASLINNNTNNSDSLNVKIWNVTSWYLKLDVDNNFELKLLKFDKLSYNNTKELIVQNSYKWSISAWSWYIQNNSWVLSLSWVITWNEYTFDFLNNDYALLVKSSSTWSLIYKLTWVSSTGTWIYINPIDDSNNSYFKYLWNDIILDENWKYIAKETELFFDK